MVGNDGTFYLIILTFMSDSQEKRLAWNSQLNIEIFRHYHIKKLVEAVGMFEVGVFEVFKDKQ